MLLGSGMMHVVFTGLFHVGSVSSIQNWCSKFDATDVENDRRADGAWVCCWTLTFVLRKTISFEKYNKTTIKELVSQARKRQLRPPGMMRRKRIARSLLDRLKQKNSSVENGDLLARMHQRRQIKLLNLSTMNFKKCRRHLAHFMDMCEAASGFDWCNRGRRSIGGERTYPSHIRVEESVELWRTDGRRTKVKVQQQSHAPSARRSFSTSVASNFEHQFRSGETLPTQTSPINTTCIMPLPSNMGQEHPERPEKTHDPSWRRTFEMPLRSSRRRKLSERWTDQSAAWHDPAGVG